MMSQLSRGMKWSRLIGAVQAIRSPSSTIFSSPKLFSTEAADTSLGSPDDPFRPTPSSGQIYAKLLNITRHTTKSDVIHLLEGCGLGTENLKVEYNLSYSPLSMMIEFPSGLAYNAALKEINRAGRVYSLRRADKSEWDTAAPYDGKVILLWGIPQNALLDDIERFLSGCQYDSSSIEIFNRSINQSNGRNVRMALVRFPSQALAMHAFITKNRSFCLNNQVSVHVLH